MSQKVYDEFNAQGINTTLLIKTKYVYAPKAA